MWDRDSLVALGVVCCCVLALGVGAGALSADLFPDADDATTEGPSEVVGDGGDPSGTPPIVVSKDIIVYLLLILVGLPLPLLIGMRRSELAAGLVAVGYWAVALGFLYLVTDGGGQIPLTEQPDPGGPTTNATVTATPGAATNGGSPTVLPFVVIAVGLLVAFVVIRHATATVDTTAETPTDETPSAGEVGRAAGRAAASLEREETDLSNAVYEAWYEMTSAVDLGDPRSATPGEFADAAVDAGMDAEHVAELTELFEVVRYGEQLPSEALEARAIDALRRIEAAHAEAADGDRDRDRDGDEDGDGDGPSTGPADGDDAAACGRGGGAE